MTFGTQLNIWRQRQNAMRSLQAHYDRLRRTDGIRFFSICSGIEAASVAWNPLGWKCVGVAEIEKFPSALLAHHYPTVKNHGDFTKIKTRTLGRVDVLCGGTPCQAFSVAGARKSLDDARGNLTLAFVDLAHDLVENNGLRNVVWENVPGVLSTKDNAFGCFLAGLVGASEPFIPTVPAPAAGKSNRWWGWSKKERAHYIKWPRSGLVTGPKGRAAWSVKDAQYFGLAQRRERVLVVADFGNGADPAAVLFEPDGVRRDSPPSRETGQGFTHSTAPSLTASGRGVERTGDNRVLTATVAVTHAIQAGALRENPNSGPDGVGVQADIAYTLEARAEVQAVSYKKWPVDIAPTLNAHFGEKQGLEDQHALGGAGLFVPAPPMVAVGVTGPISHALKAEGADASEDGTGRGTPIIAFSAKDHALRPHRNLSPTLRAGGHSTSHANAGVMPAVAMTVALRGRDGGATAELGGDIATALRASGGGGDKAHVLTSAVRRLTPRECERLQGFQFLVHATYPDAWQDELGRWWSPDYTAIPWRKRPADECPDGPRYKVLGNSWAVPKFRWLGMRIAALMPPRR